jgi:hypothetical protein
MQSVCSQATDMRRKPPNVHEQRTGPVSGEKSLFGEFGDGPRRDETRAIWPLRKED